MYVIPENYTSFCGHKNPYITIDGNSFNSKPIGYCLYSKHKGYLTVKISKVHKCFEKNCKFLIINPEHEYTTQLQKMREYKERKRKKIKLRKNIDSLWLNGKISYDEYKFLKKNFHNAKSDMFIDRLRDMIEDDYA